MEFCSKYGYDYGFNGSDSEEISDEELSDDNQTEKKITRRFRRADANIIAVKFDQLVKSNQMQAGDPIPCKFCQAYMSIISKEHINKNTWKCEFCDESNELDSGFDINQIPKLDDVTYLIEAAPLKETKNEVQILNTDDKTKSSDNNFFTFCMDISGSMNTGIKNNMTRLDGVKVACLENLEKLKEEEPNKRVSLITFSESVKFYGDCKKSNPIVSTSRSSGGIFGSRRPRQQNMQRQQYNQKQQSTGLFGSFKLKAANMFSLGPKTRSQTKVNVVQDTKPSTNSSGLSESESEEEEKEHINVMTNKEKMLTLAVNQDGDSIRGISESYNDLADHIKKLHTEGSTALGPGLTLAIGFTGKKSGSQIILCTDGCANVGMGSMGYGQQHNSGAQTFYDELAEDARERGVTVNVVSVEGTDCKLALLGTVADKTNGTLNIVNPMNLSEQFKSILENRIVANNVKAKLIVNKKYLYVRDEDLEIAESKAIESNDMAQKEALNDTKKSCQEKTIGNANIDSEITFEYGIRKLKEKKYEKKIGKMPFQLQITYTSEDGAIAVRVYTKFQEFTADRKTTEDNSAQNDIIWTNAQQKMSSHFLTSNTVVAKFKSRQMRNFQRNTNFQSPKKFVQQQELLDTSKKTRRVSDLNDSEAQQVYNGRKANRKKM